MDDLVQKAKDWLDEAMRDGCDAISFDADTIARCMAAFAAQMPGRFAVYGYDTYYPSGGFDGDLIAKVATREEADRICEQFRGRYDYTDWADLLEEMQTRKELD